MLTMTKQRAAAHELRKAVGDANVVPWEIVAQVAGRLSSPADWIREVAEELGYMVAGGATRIAGWKADPPVQEAPRPRPRISDVVIRSIETGAIFKRLREPEPGEDPDAMLVVTTVGQLTREREAIRRWVEEAKAGLHEA